MLREMLLRPARRGAFLLPMIRGWFFSHWAAEPGYNMAFDEWMLSWAAEHPGAVILRLYTWRVGTITFGYNQKQDVALAFDRLGGTPAIRRVTGGRAVYHDVSELTYSVAINPQVPELRELAGSIPRVHRRLALALQDFLARLGVVADIAERSSAENARPEFFHKAPCFASHARDELKSDGRKVVASAQRRFGDALLQHGSIKLTGTAAHAALGDILPGNAGAPQPLDKEQFDVAAPLLVGAFETALGVCFAQCGFTIEVESAVQRRCQMVAQNPLTRRDIL